MSLSRTALQVKLERYEIEALVDWHIERKRNAADKEEYTDAEWHRKRAKELAEIHAQPMPGPDSDG
jgi:hypothetical protein